MPEHKPQAAPKAEAPPAVRLGDAGASSDPAVHSLLARRATAAANGDKDGVTAADDALAEWGVTV